MPLDRWWDDEDEDEDGYYRHAIVAPQSPIYAEEFDTGAVEPDKIYPAAHGPGCQGHEMLRSWYNAYHKWTYIRVPPKPFEYDPNVVRGIKEEYL